MPFFSIVTACKDGLRFLEETIPTILNQTFRDWEWLFVDDGSAEPVADRMRALGDQRIRVFHNEKSMGQTASLNRAISESGADWIVRVDADDLSMPSRLESCRKAILGARTSPPVLLSGYDVIHEDGAQICTVLYREPLREGFYRYLEKRNNPIAHPGVCFRKFAPNGALYLYDENLRNAQDYELWRRIRRDHPYAAFQHIPDALLTYRLVRQSLSGARANEQAVELEAIRADNPVAAAGVQLPALGKRQQDAMYAYRVFYYRFIGSFDKKMKIRQFLALLASLSGSGKNIGILLKSLAFILLWPLKAPLKKFFFSGIYK